MSVYSADLAAMPRPNAANFDDRVPTLTIGVRVEVVNGRETFAVWNWNHAPVATPTVSYNGRQCASRFGRLPPLKEKEVATARESAGVALLYEGPADPVESMDLSLPCQIPEAEGQFFNIRIPGDKIDRTSCVAWQNEHKK